ncbi:chemotaxis protein CheC [bacterium]|jgi:hypothetical protein|nr:chemotaxis protein CheC [bacterium]
MDLQALEQSLPSEFEFFHLGKVSRDRSATFPQIQFIDKAVVGFTLQGDFRGALLVVFDQGLDVSMYSEMGNIIASQLVTNLSKQGLDVVISPPKTVGSDQALKLVEQASRLPGGNGIAQQRFLHFNNLYLVNVETLILGEP